MQDDYYAHHSRVQARRHMALLAAPGVGVNGVARYVSGLTGVPFVALDRLVEHEAGMTRAQLVLQQGEPALRQLEQACLRRALAGRPYGVIAIGDVTPGWRVRMTFRRRARALFLRPPLAVAQRVALERHKNTPALIPGIMDVEGSFEQRVEVLYAARVRELRGFADDVEVGDEAPLVSARRCIERMGWALDGAST